MRAIHAELVLVSSGLVAVASAEALPTEDIPVQCARICGPMVELTSQCTPKLAARRSNPDASHGELGVSGRRNRRRETGGEGDLGKKQVVVIVAPPKSPGSGRLPTSNTTTTSERPGGVSGAEPSNGATLTPSTATATVPPPTPPLFSPSQSGGLPSPGPFNTSTPARASTSSSLPSRTAVSPLPSASPSSPQRSSSRLSTASKPGQPSSSSRAPSQRTSDFDRPRQRPASGRNGVLKSMPLGAEEKCVCLNTSFNVSEVAALCDSCIMQAGNTMNNLNIIMSTCNFSPMLYAESDDSLVQDVRVSATRPTVVGSQNGVVSRAPHLLGVTLRFLYLAMATATFVWA